jgi:hypothetical protein
VIIAKRLRQFFLEEARRPTAAWDGAAALEDADEHLI